VSKPTDLVTGQLDMLILKTVALQPMTGWGHRARSHQVSNEVWSCIRVRLDPPCIAFEKQKWLKGQGE